MSAQHHRVMIWWCKIQALIQGGTVRTLMQLHFASSVHLPDTRLGIAYIACMQRVVLCSRRMRACPYSTPPKRCQGVPHNTDHHTAVADMSNCTQPSASRMHLGSQVGPPPPGESSASQQQTTDMFPGGPRLAGIIMREPPALPNEQELLVELRRKLGCWADQGKLLYQVRSSRGKLHWAGRSGDVWGVPLFGMQALAGSVHVPNRQV